MFPKANLVHSQFLHHEHLKKKYGSLGDGCGRKQQIQQYMCSLLETKKQFFFQEKQSLGPEEVSW